MQLKGRVKDAVFSGGRLYCLMMDSDVVRVDGPQQHAVVSRGEHLDVQGIRAGLHSALLLAVGDGTLHRMIDNEIAERSASLGGVVEDAVQCLQADAPLLVSTVKPHKRLFVVSPDLQRATEIASFNEHAGIRLLAVQRFVLSFRCKGATLRVHDGTTGSPVHQEALPVQPVGGQGRRGGSVVALAAAGGRRGHFFAACWQGVVVHGRVDHSGRYHCLGVVDMAGDPATLVHLACYGAHVYVAGSESVSLYVYEPSSRRVGRVPEVEHQGRIKAIGRAGSSLCTVAKDGSVKFHAVPFVVDEEQEEPQEAGELERLREENARLRRELDAVRAWLRRAPIQ